MHKISRVKSDNDLISVSLNGDSYVSQAFPIRKCPEGCVKRCKAPQFRMAVKLARMSHLSYARPLHPLTRLISSNKKSPILLEFRGTG